LEKKKKGFVFYIVSIFFLPPIWCRAIMAPRLFLLLLFETKMSMVSDIILHHQTYIIFNAQEKA